MALFDKSVDFRAEQKPVKKSEALGKVISNGLREENGKVVEIFSWHFVFSLLILLLLVVVGPVWLLFKLIEYIHLITIVIFGVLFVYFGVTGLLGNPWTDTALYLLVGSVLVLAPILYAFDKDK